MAIFFSCSKSDNNSGTGSHACAFSTPTINATAAGTVKYEVKLDGTGKVNQIVIKTNSGDSTISSPGLPFQTTLSVSNTTAIGISATGSTSGGTISIEYSFIPSGGGTLVSNENECGN